MFMKQKQCSFRGLVGLVTGLWLKEVVEMSEKVEKYDVEASFHDVRHDHTED